MAGDVTLVAVVNLQMVWVSWRPGRSGSKFQPLGRLRLRSGRTLSLSIAERGRGDLREWQQSQNKTGSRDGFLL